MGKPRKQEMEVREAVHAELLQEALETLEQEPLRASEPRKKAGRKAREKKSRVPQILELQEDHEEEAGEVPIESFLAKVSAPEAAGSSPAAPCVALDLPESSEEEPEARQPATESAESGALRQLLAAWLAEAQKPQGQSASAEEEHEAQDAREASAEEAAEEVALDSKESGMLRIPLEVDLSPDKDGRQSELLSTMLECAAGAFDSSQEEESFALQLKQPATCILEGSEDIGEPAAVEHGLASKLDSPDHLDRTSCREPEPCQEPELQTCLEADSLDCSDNERDSEPSIISLQSGQFCARSAEGLMGFESPLTSPTSAFSREAEQLPPWALGMSEDRRVRAELAMEAERYIEEASAEMEHMVQRLEQEEQRREEDELRWRELAKSYRAECQHWEEVASRAHNEVELENSRTKKAREQADELLQSVEEGHAKVEEAVSSKREEERQRWLALEAWQAADDAKTSMQLKLREVEMEKCRLEEEVAEMAKGFEEQRAACRTEEASVREHQREEAAACEAARLQWQHEVCTMQQETAICRVETAERRVSHVMARCGVGRQAQHEARDLMAELRFWTEEARERERKAHLEAGVHLAECRQLEEAQAEARGAAEVVQREAMEAAAAQARQECEMQEQEALAMQRREEPQHPFGCLLSNVPLAVRIPSFEVKKEGLSSRVVYTIAVEGPGKSETLTRHFGEFRDLHDQLNARPFASLLQARPQDWFFAHLSTAMLERQRRQLEAYLAFLCAHSHVLLDATIWRWLAVDDLTQVAARLVAASEVKWSNEVCRLVQTLEAVIAAGGDESLCVHPSVLRVLREVLLDSFDEVARSSACRVLERLLSGSRRARQLFLAPEAGGAAALVAVAKCRGDAGRAASDAAWRILEVLAAAESELSDEVQIQAAQTVAVSPSRGAPRPGECCVCLDRGKSHAFLPCGHLVACMDCAAYLAARAMPCPACRCPIERAVQIFS